MTTSTTLTAAQNEMAEIRRVYQPQGLIRIGTYAEPTCFTAKDGCKHTKVLVLTVLHGSQLFWHLDKLRAEGPIGPHFPGTYRLYLCETHKERDTHVTEFHFMQVTP